MKRTMKNLTLAALSVVVLVLALEVVLRATHLFGARLSWTEPDPAIGWRFTPGRDYWFDNENTHAITGRINALGYRDYERSLEKPAGTYRVAVVGDSYVEAFQVELDSTFVAIAERELDERLGVPVEVMNMGRSGMTITEELVVMREAKELLDADVIVLVFVPLNDIADMRPETTHNVMRPFVRGFDGSAPLIDTSFNLSPGFEARRRMNAFKQRSALLSLLAERVNAWRMARRHARLESLGRADAAAQRHEGGIREITGTLTLCTDSPDSAYAAGYALWKRVFLNAAAEMERGDGPEVLLMTVPLVYTTDDIAQCRAAAPSFDPGYFDGDLGDTWSPYLGLQEAFETRYRRTGERLHWAHWNYAGHRLVGTLLARRLAASHGK